MASGLIAGSLWFVASPSAAPMTPGNQSLATEAVVHKVQTAYCLRRHYQCSRRGHKLRYRRCMRRYGC